jgi:hypothetical protein
MEKPVDINEILLKVKMLKKDEQMNLLERIFCLVNSKEIQNDTFKLSTITGKGSNIWKNTDIDQYIANEREW